MSAIGTLLKVLQLPDRSGFWGISAPDRCALVPWCFFLPLQAQPLLRLGWPLPDYASWALVSLFFNSGPNVVPPRVLILPPTLINHLARQILLSPIRVFDLADELRVNPMHSAQHRR